MKRLLLFVAVALATGAAAIAVPLQLDLQQSSIAVLVHATAHSFTGQLEKFDAKLEVDAQAALPARAEVTFDFGDLKTGNRSRDQAMLKWLEYSNHPTATFHLTGWKQSGTTNLALGDFTLHGVTNTVQMPVTLKHDGAAWSIDGEADIDHRDYKLPRIRTALVLTVDPHLKVTFHLVGKVP